MSEGPDSVLAGALLRARGFGVHALHFRTGFGRKDLPGRAFSLASIERNLGCAVEIVDVRERYVPEVVVGARHGYGTGMNPCLDCRIHLFRRAGDLARRRGCDLVATGEILGQHPWCQSRESMAAIERASGLEGLLLRPLSAALLPPTRIEREGLIDREALGRIHGRSRAGLDRLARELALPQPLPSRGGCCILSDAGFARRLRDLLSHRDPAAIGRDELSLLRVGRHLRLGHALRVVAARDEPESRLLERIAGARWRAQVEDGRGSLAVVAEGDPHGPDAPRIAAVAARYSRHRAEAETTVTIWRPGESLRLRVAPAPSTARWLV